MTIRWKPDSCDCIIHFDVPTTFVQWEKKCDIHKAFTGQTLLDNVITHNQSFQINIGPQNSASSRDTNMATKIAAKAAIIAGGASVKNTGIIIPRALP